MMDLVFKTMDFVLKMMDFVLKMMDFALKMMGFVLKMMDFALKMTDSAGKSAEPGANCIVINISHLKSHFSYVSQSQSFSGGIFSASSLHSQGVNLHFPLQNLHLH